MGLRISVLNFILMTHLMDLTCLSRFIKNFRLFFKLIFFKILILNILLDEIG